MLKRSLAPTLGLAVACTLLAPTLGAHGTIRRTMYLTFSRAVALPGVTLPAGSYTFELADPIGAPDVVRVLSRRDDKVYFQGFTMRVSRPAGSRDLTPVAFGEAPAGEPLPIRVWYPADEQGGREFFWRR
jgi:hypothetical protein